MAQKLTPAIAEAEAAKLLTMALAMLDEAESLFASAYVAQALDLLTRRPDAPSSDDIDLPEPGHFQPSWGYLVDR